MNSKNCTLLLGWANTLRVKIILLTNKQMGEKFAALNVTCNKCQTNMLTFVHRDLKLLQAAISQLAKC